MVGRGNGNTGMAGMDTVEDEGRGDMPCVYRGLDLWLSLCVHENMLMIS